MTINPSDESVFNRSSILVFNQSPFGLRNVADIIWFGVENSKQDGFRTHAEMSSNLLLDALFLAIFFFWEFFIELVVVVVVNLAHFWLGWVFEKSFRRLSYLEHLGLSIQDFIQKPLSHVVKHLIIPVIFIDSIHEVFLVWAFTAVVFLWYVFATILSSMKLFEGNPVFKRPLTFVLENVGSSTGMIGSGFHILVGEEDVDLVDGATKEGTKLCKLSKATTNEEALHQFLPIKRVVVIASLVQKSAIEF